jgi:hypothetical protein
MTIPQCFTEIKTLAWKEGFREESDVGDEGDESDAEPPLLSSPSSPT